MWGVLSFYKQNHAIVCSHPLGSCFTAPSEAHQNRARLPIMSYRTIHKTIGIKKALVNYFLLHVPYTLPSTHPREERSLL